MDNMLLYFDKISMAASLEVRVPFMDHDVVSFCSQLPDSRRVWRLRRKELLKRASRGLVEDAIIDKPKRGFFHSALGAWLEVHRDGLVPDTLLDEPCAGARPVPARGRARSRGARARGRQEGKPAALLPPAPRALAADFVDRETPWLSMPAPRLTSSADHRRHPPGRRARAEDAALRARAQRRHRRRVAGGRQRLHRRHTRPLERELPDVRSTRAEHRLRGGQQPALPRARGRYVLLLNPDIEVVVGHPGRARHCDGRAPRGRRGERRFSSGRTGGVQRTIRRFPSPARQIGEALLAAAAARPRCASARRRRARSPYGMRSRPTGSSASSCSSGARRSRPPACMDERFFLFSEETDWCYRIRRAGWGIRHLPVMTVVHHTGRSARPDLFAQNCHSKVLYARKHFRGRAQRAVSRRDRAAARTAPRAGRAGRARAPGHAPACQRRAAGARWS